VKWTCRDSGYWESEDGQWRLQAKAEGTRVYWRIYHLDPALDRWRRSGIKGRHDTLASAKVAVAMFVEDAAR
jgi:hypothetical protein